MSHVTQRFWKMTITAEKPGTVFVPDSRNFENISIDKLCSGVPGLTSREVYTLKTKHKVTITDPSEPDVLITIEIKPFWSRVEMLTDGFPKSSEAPVDTGQAEAVIAEVLSTV
jgi:hypothetical protein